MTAKFPQSLANFSLPETIQTKSVLDWAAYGLALAYIIRAFVYGYGMNDVAALVVSGCCVYAFSQLRKK